MQEQQFAIFIQYVTPPKNYYDLGYQRGLRRFYHGEKFGTQSEHEEWMNLSGNRKNMGKGYQDGFSGLPPAGYHGNIGNQNARKEQTADSTLVIRLNSRVKAGYVKQAQKEGLKLSEWVLKKLSVSDQQQ